MKKQPPAPTAREIFARNLRKARRLAEISQLDLALTSGMSRTYLSEVERGIRNISIDNMGELAAALNRPLKELVDPDLFEAK